MTQHIYLEHSLFCQMSFLLLLHIVHSFNQNSMSQILCWTLAKKTVKEIDSVPVL